MFSRTLLIVLISLAMNAHAGDKPHDLPNEDAIPELSAVDKQKAAALIAALGADEFEKRESAQKDLAAIGAGAIPLLKSAAETADDAEVKSRAANLLAQLEKQQRIGKVLAECKNDPDQVMVKAMDIRKTDKGTLAAELFIAAAELYRAGVAKSDDPRARQLAEAKALMCERRAKSATGTAAVAGNGQVIIQGQAVQVNGGQIRIRVNGANNEVDFVDLDE